MAIVNNFAPGNAGVFFWMDIVVPLFGALLLWLQHRRWPTASLKHEYSGIDHQLLWLALLGGQLSQNPIEYAEPAPANEAVTDRGVWTMVQERLTICSDCFT
ncbi:DUF6790 family protein [Rhizobium sp. Root1220]|uniref:DUF6790 family protein n=1 Tax=Rhizobium sp. Root1220 TaxID=1736432 RepID=UPI0006F94226|nr:DUF6790 family protein [Rhizobium sp. Root1220]KQV70453.1 hypothetical protein ASC90_10170 [Rhizobium sp. Root1220]